MKNHLFSFLKMSTPNIWTFNSLLFLILCAQSCSTKKIVSKSFLEGFKIVPTICEFIPPDYNRGKFGIQVEVDCQSPADTSFWMICNNDIKKISCNHYSNEIITRQLIYSCEKEFFILNKDNKIAGRIPFYSEYNMIRVGLQKNGDDIFMNEYEYYFYVLYY